MLPPAAFVDGESASIKILWFFTSHRRRLLKSPAFLRSAVKRQDFRIRDSGLEALLVQPNGWRQTATPSPVVAGGRRP